MASRYAVHRVQPKQRGRLCFLCLDGWSHKGPDLLGGGDFSQQGGVFVEHSILLLQQFVLGHQRLDQCRHVRVASAGHVDVAWSRDVL